MATFNVFVHRILAVSLEQKDRLEKTNMIIRIAIVNGYNCEIIDKLIRKHSVKINNKSKSAGPLKKDIKFISTEYTNVLSVIIQN